MFSYVVLAIFKVAFQKLSSPTSQLEAETDQNKARKSLPKHM